jgi:hypothetical protein
MNRQKPHLFVLPEDDANRQIANGFLLGLESSARVQVLHVAGGWYETINRFESDHVADMDRFRERFMVLLIDFDEESSRIDKVKDRIPERLRERVFVLGVWSEPEKLKQAGLGSYEQIGRSIAKDCRDKTQWILNHELLLHNAGELERLRVRVGKILFPHVA